MRTSSPGPSVETSSVNRAWASSIVIACTLKLLRPALRRDITRYSTADGFPSDRVRGPKAGGGSLDHRGIEHQGAEIGEDGRSSAKPNGSWHLCLAPNPRSARTVGPREAKRFLAPLSNSRPNGSWHFCLSNGSWHLCLRRREVEVSTIAGSSTKVPKSARTVGRPRSQTGFSRTFDDGTA